MSSVYSVVHITPSLNNALLHFSQIETIITTVEYNNHLMSSLSHLEFPAHIFAEKHWEVMRKQHDPTLPPPVRAYRWMLVGMH